MKTTDQAEKARQFHSLHDGPHLLLLPNAWDAISAAIFAEAGFPAIASTSAGVANAMGYPDGQKISRAEMLSAVARIVRAVQVPVTADMEAGYGSTPEEMAETARGVIEAGAVGLNLEDSPGEGTKKLFDLSLQKEKIRAMFEVGEKLKVPLVINARTDVYLDEIGEPATRFDRTVERLNAFRDSGATSLFAPGVKDAETIGRLVRAVRGPLNILATAGTPPVRELEKLGVARVSVGSGVMRATLGMLSRLAKHLREQGTFEPMTDGAMPYAEANRLVSATKAKPAEGA
jgi:2-methylisocitrate lyase-like PEP mutase family enzyme